MFDRVVIRPVGSVVGSDSLDIGAVVEGMLFYSDVQVVVHAGCIAQMGRLWSHDAILPFLDAGHAKFRYQQNGFCIRTQNAGSARERFEPVSYEVSERFGGDTGPEPFLRRTLYELTGSKGRARHLAAQVAQRLQVFREDEQLAARAKQDLLDPESVPSGVRQILRDLVPELHTPTSTIFEVDQVGDGLRVRTNIDFTSVNSAFHAKTSQTANSITPAYLLSHFLSARELLEFAAKEKCDMAATALTASLAAAHVDALARRYTKAAAQFSAFQAMLVPGAKSIREAVNSGRVSAKEVLDLLADARSFRAWLGSRPPDAELLEEYVRSLSEKPWIAKLDAKVLRFAIFQALGFAASHFGLGPAAEVIALGTSAVDNFLVDPLVAGWRPNQFVEGVLVPRLRP